jgi:hypothetical protein
MLLVSISVIPNTHLIMSLSPYYILKESTCTAPVEIQTSIKECINNLKLMQDIWYTRRECLSQRNLLKITTTTFSLWVKMESNCIIEILQILRMIKMLDISRNVRCPRKISDQEAKLFDHSKRRFQKNLDLVFDYYTNLNK